MAHVSMIPVTDLHRWERNPRLHPDSNIAQLCASLRQFGLARLPVLATWPGQTEGRIIAGNGITTALQRMYEGDPAHPPQGVDGGTPWLIPVRPRHFDSQLAAEEYGLVDNWSTEASVDDPLPVTTILTELQDNGFDMSGLFKSDEDLALLLNPPALPSEDDWSRAMDGLPDTDRQPIQQMTFTLHDDQVATIKNAIEKAKAMGDFVDTGNENSNGNALARIAEFFVGGS